MAVTKIDVEELIRLSKIHPVIDVRSEGEYQHAHIPFAYALPLFNNEERKIVGTAYKQQSREAAIKIGLDFFGKKMRAMVEEVEKLITERDKKVHGKRLADKTRNDNSKTILIHCWRGGMRSGAVAWLLDLYGFKVFSLSGGYKAFRNWVLKQFEKEYNFYILGGYTGSGKTYVLHESQNRGEKIIDLEYLAGHKGSAFGNIGSKPQPSQEMFENMLAVELDDRCRMTDEEPLWLEDESQRIGLVNIPNALWKTMRRKPVYFLNIHFEERLQHIVKEYGKADKEKLINAILRIQKRLGGLEAKTALNFLLENDVTNSFRILLSYYDKQYLKALNNREMDSPLITKIECCKVDAKENAEQLLHLVNK